MDDELTVRISSLEHYLYCPRQCALIDVEGQWVDNEHVVRGEFEHRRADSGRHRRERGRQVLRSIPLWSQVWGLTGRADIVEVSDAAVTPVEYKAGVRHGQAADVQLCAQAICLEEMFSTEVEVGYVWYSANRRRMAVVMDEALREDTIKAIEAVRSMLRDGCTPAPSADRRCEQCQLQARCLPFVTCQPWRAEKLLTDLLGGER
jgi:CRISPR-associated exonuclease Cas4